MFSPSAMLSPQLFQPSLPFIQFDILFEQFTYDFNSFPNKGPIKQLILLYDTYDNGLCLLVMVVQLYEQRSQYSTLFMIF